MIRKTLLVLLSVGLVCGFALAATKTIVLKDESKTTYTGDVTEVGGAYQIKLPTGEVISYPKDQATVSAASDPSVEYKSRLAKIDEGKPDDAADKHKEIGDWAQKGGYLSIAYVEYSKALELKPGDEVITLHLQQVKSTLDALVKGGTKVEETATKPETGPESTNAQTNLVSDEDLYKIRMFEITNREIKDIPPVFDYADKKVASDFVNRMRKDGKVEYQNINALTVFLNRSKADQLLRIRKDINDQDFLDRVHITSDPEFMRAYRRDVAPHLKASCAQSECHGAPKGKGELKLFTIKNDRADYTNFLILSLWEKNGKYLVDRRTPEDSMLLQHGLPTKLATAGFAHPNVALRQPLFRSATADNYVRILNWIKILNGAVTPAYRTVYQPPVGRKLTSGGAGFVSEEPTSAPASKPAEEETKDSSK